MKLGSLFDGSGGFPLAGAHCGIAPVWASEIEPYPIAVTKSRFPFMKHYGDISKINGAEIEPVDIITFGSPCQDLSVAGKRAGLKHEANGDDETTRSGLFMEFVDEVSLGYKGTIDLNLLREAADRLKAMDAQIYQHREEIADLEKQLAEQQTQWISAEDRLPGAHGRYISYNGEDIKIRSFDHVRQGSWIIGEVTHWMPLPEPPKPKEPTFKDVFLEKFPKAPIDEDGIPKACIADVFPWAKHKHCDGWMCFEDWSQPYFEEEGGAE